MTDTKTLNEIISEIKEKYGEKLTVNRKEMEVWDTLSKDEQDKLLKEHGHVPEMGWYGSTGPDYVQPPPPTQLVLDNRSYLVINASENLPTLFKLAKEIQISTGKGKVNFSSSRIQKRQECELKPTPLLQEMIDLYLNRVPESTSEEFLNMFSQYKDFYPGGYVEVNSHLFEENSHMVEIPLPSSLDIKLRYLDVLTNLDKIYSALELDMTDK